jgi:4-amino-4-deoxy-L-arabinose transferase-like glycosyltransferase
MSNVQLVPTPVQQSQVPSRFGQRPEIVVLFIAAAVYLLNIVSPPSLLDDVDAWQALMAKNMYRTGDWVTARVDGVVYFEKAPLKYWITIGFYRLFGVHDWVARIPIALFAIGLALLLVRMSKWGFDDRRTELYAGIVISTCVGLFLFTRFIIPDVLLTLTCSLALYGFIRAIEPDEPHPRRWAYLLASACAAGVLTKGLIGLVIPGGAVFFYLLATRQLFRATVWKRMYPFTGTLLFLAIAVPWHVLASLRNPPVLDFTMHSGPGQYHGFFWFYFINEQVLRFLNLRYPRDYNTVPRLAFWAFHLLWLFPWSVYLPSVFKLDYRPATRAGRLRLLCACWIGFVLLFFTFSTTQEYYSMPIYPALALLLACGMAKSDRWVRVGNWILAGIALAALATIAGLLIVTAHVPTPGDISVALSRHPSDYTLSLGHMMDLTVESFAYLRVPLALAGFAFLVGAAGAFFLRGRRALLGFAAMMVVFYLAARLAMVTFDPYMSSRPLAEALNHAPPGKLIIQDDINRESSVLFYHTDQVLIYNGRYYVMEYGSYAPDAPNVFIGDNDLKRLWAEGKRYYLLVPNDSVLRIREIMPANDVYTLASIGGKTVLTNEPVSK